MFLPMLVKQLYFLIAHSRPCTKTTLGAAVLNKLARRTLMTSQKRAHPGGDNSGSDYINQDAALKHPPPKRAKEIDRKSPMTELSDLVKKSRSRDVNARVILHWFRAKDLRQEDNKALHVASQKARENGVPLITMFLHSPQDMEWHGTSPARIDFVVESLRALQKGLEDRNIPLTIINVEERTDKVKKVVQHIKNNNVSHIFANYEYEIDELRRDIDLTKQVLESDGLTFDLFHDQTILVPGTVTTGSGGPQKVFTPYHKHWLAATKEDPSLFDVIPPPEENAESIKKELHQLFHSPMPEIPQSKKFKSNDERQRIRKLWPAGHDAGITRLNGFLADQVLEYARTRSRPAEDSTSRLSPYLASGAVSVREVLSRVKQANQNQHFNEGDPGIAAWVREIVFREFYRQVTVTTPHTTMNLPQNLKFDYVQWEDDDEGWVKWCEGRTGVPFVDAGMRQLRAEAYMHNRLRMNVSSYLSGNLLIDYRKGERFFAENLVDWDLNNNTQGWEPSFTVFNPVSQAEKNDPNGDYIRRWVPELKDLQGKEIFAPHDRLSRADFDRLGYVKPHVDYAESVKRAKERYKSSFDEANI